MAKHYVTDDRHSKLKAWAANHPEYGLNQFDLEYRWWRQARSKTATPWGDDRNTAITAAATAFSVTLTETAPWPREQQFWSLYTPTALP